MNIEEILKLSPGTPVPETCGMVKGVGPFSEGQDPVPWSLQCIFIQDAKGSIPVKIGNHPKIAPEVVGTVLYFVAHKKANGGLSGLKVDTDRQMEDGKPKEWLTLAVARSAEILTEEEWAKKNQPAEKPTPAPVTPTNIAPTTPQPKPEAQPPTPKVVAGPVVQPPCQCGEFRFIELRYERTVNTGNYCSEKLGVTVEIPAGFPQHEALARAKEFVASNLPPEFVPAQGARKI